MVHQPRTQEMCFLLGGMWSLVAMLLWVEPVRLSSNPFLGDCGCPSVSPALSGIGHGGAQGCGAGS